MFKTFFRTKLIWLFLMGAAPHWALAREAISGCEERLEAAAQNLVKEVAVHPFSQQGLFTCWAHAGTAVLENYIRRKSGQALSLSTDAILYRFIQRAMARIPTQYRPGLGSENGLDDIRSLLGRGNRKTLLLDLWKELGLMPLSHFNFSLGRGNDLKGLIQELLTDFERLQHTVNSSQSYSQRWFEEWTADRLNRKLGTLSAELHPKIYDSESSDELGQKLLGTDWKARLHWEDLYRRGKSQVDLSGDWLAEHHVRSEDRPSYFRTLIARFQLKDKLRRFAASNPPDSALLNQIRSAIDQGEALYSTLLWNKEMIEKSRGNIESDWDSHEALAKVVKSITAKHAVVIRGYKKGEDGLITHLLIQEGVHSGFDGRGSHWIRSDLFLKRVSTVSRLTE